MARFQQFEVWQMVEDRWEFIASFMDFNVASGMAKTRAARVRLLKVSYADGAAAEQEILAEVGQMRGQP
jgi:hypothetical protein